MFQRCLFLSVLLGTGLLTLTLPAQKPNVLPPTVFALRDACVVAAPGEILPKATVIVRDGVIESVGSGVKVPADALVIDCKGLTIYPGFIDGLGNGGFDAALRRSEGGPPEAADLASQALASTPADNRKGMTPEFLVGHALKADDQADAWCRAGITARLIAPEGGFFAGQSALVSLSGAVPREAVLRSPVALHAAFRGVGGSDYPRALMGIVAHCRQTLLDAGHYRQRWQDFEKRGQVGKRPPVDPALAALLPALDRKQPVVFEADTTDEIHRALDFAEEFHLQPILYGGRDAWKAADRIKTARVPILLRLNFTEADAPAARVRPGPGPRTRPRGQAGPRGGPRTGPRQPAPRRVEEDLERQRREEHKNAALLQQQGVPFAFSTQGQTGDNPAEKFRANLRLAIAAGLKPEAALRALTSDAAKILGVEKQLGTIAAGKAAHLVVTDGDFQEAGTQVRYVFADGIRFEYENKPKKPASGGRKPPEGSDKSGDSRPRRASEVPTEIEEDRVPQLHTGGNVLLRGATLVTVTHGNKANTDLLVRGGKIAALGAGLKAPEGVTVIDATSLFIMPGIIDTHSHFAISGGVNEFSLSVVPEVRVRDVINSEDVQIYRAAAGGVTTARLLHGSANVIGGQDAVIKMKYGKPAKELLVAGAPRGVKFALGENVKRTDGRFPNSRLGVEAVLVRAFTEAKAYQHTWDEYERSLKKPASGSTPRPMPRRDLRLEALADVLKGELKVHCHCYRADEILMLLRVADRFGFKIKSLQHVLEGYKIAPEIAAHGASCSSFSDWWAYKIEAFDAIPFNAALLHEAGAEVCLKSDSNELMRHLYQEAAKCIKYGGMSETDALKTITLNGAKQLGLEKRIGSLEVGKDADLAIFNGHPLNSYSRVEMTLIEGEVVFQRSDKLAPASFAAAAPAKPATGFKPVPRNAAGSYAISGATVHPVSGGVVPEATVFVEKGKIKEVRRGTVLENTRTNFDGKEVSAVAVNDNGKIIVVLVPPGTKVVDARGLHLYPGMLDAGTVLGLTELGSARETHDYAEGGDFQPDLRASSGINPDSELIPVTRANGVTTVVTRPTGSIVAGQSALIDLAGWVPKEMTLVDPLALHIDFPSPGLGFLSSDPNAPRAGRAIARRQRDEKIRRLKELFRQAVAYDAGRKAEPDRGANPRLEALIPYARGSKPVIIQAQREEEIREALKLADELKLKVILSGASEAWKVAGELKKRGVPVIVGPILSLPRERYDPYDAAYAAPARLHQAGVKFCIRSAGSTNTRNLPYEAAMAASYGLPPEEALKAVTLYPAQILGVDKELGSIEVGKRANLVLANGDLLQASTQVVGLFIGGRPLPPTSKHTRLYERYRERLREVKEGRAPLGTK